MALAASYPRQQPRDRHLAAIKAGLAVRALGDGALAQNRNGARVDVLRKYAPEAAGNRDAGDYTSLPLSAIAEECLIIDGHHPDAVRRMTRTELAMLAFGQHPVAGSGGAVHTTGSLLEVSRDAVNKSLRAGYGEAPTTWRGPMRQGQSVADFKDIHRVKLGGAQNLPIWPDNTAPSESRLSSEAEKYAVEAHAENLSFSWRMIVNDDVDALTRVPAMLGDASARTVNAVAWQELTRNPVLADGQPLLLETPTGRRHQSNLTTGEAVPTNATIGAMKAKMRVMRGLSTPEGAQSDSILNLMPAYIVGPAALEEVIVKLVFSDADPAAGGNSAVFNTSRTLTPVIEPLLDLDSATAWYLFASPSRVDTVEVSFLAGQEEPVTRDWIDPRTMSQNFTIIQTFAAKAIDFRGIQKHTGVN